MARKISVEIVGDSRSLERAFARSSRAGDRFNRQMTSRFTGTVKGFSSLARSIPVIGAAFGGAAIVGGIGKAIEAASDLNEQLNRSRVTFRRSSTTIERWSQTTADAIGLSQTAALEATSNFGAMFKTIGVGDRSAAAMSKRLTVLGADMASFNNQDPSEMLDRLRSGLAGEAEPLRRFGVLLSEARVKQEAYRSGIAKAGATLTEQQKVQARYNLILQDTRLQQGDFARTSEQLANQLRTLRAHFSELGAKLGTALLPSATKLVDKLNDWLADGNNQKQLVKDLTELVEGLGEAARITADIWNELHVSFTHGVNVVKELPTQTERLRKRTVGGTLGFLGGLLPSKSVLGRRFNEIEGELTFEGKQLSLRLRQIGQTAGNAMTEGFGETAMDHRALMKIRAARRRAEEAVGGAGGGAVTARRRGITPAQRNQFFDARIARQLNRLQDLSLRKQLAGLRVIAQTIRAQIAVRHDRTRQLTLNDQLLDIYRQQRDVQGQITGEIKAANAALKDRADAIKSAILERLERRQATIENQRALRDARARLREALAIAGPRGARLARENLADVLSERTRQQLAAAPARLTRGGRFTLGNVITINIHGVTDPNAVAIKVDEILKKRARRNSPPMRGPAAAGAGTH